MPAGSGPTLIFISSSGLLLFQTLGSPTALRSTGAKFRRSLAVAPASMIVTTAAGNFCATLATSSASCSWMAFHGVNARNWSAMFRWDDMR